MIGETVSHYKILKKLGEGGMGEVYLAEDTSLNRKVALKFLPTALQDDSIAHRRFLREAKAAAALDHPFICNIYEVGLTEAGQDFICMEYVEGQTLNERLAQGLMEERNALSLAMEIAQALDKAHRDRIVHRDLKPSNIILTPDNHPKVMDFGLAKRVISSDSTEEDISSVLTREGSALGTLAYMSPEQVKGKSVDHRSDIFSFGIVVYEMLTGVHPFRRSTQAETAGSILHEDPAPLAEHRADSGELLQGMISRLLAKEPDRRYQSVQSVLTDLKKLVENTRDGGNLPSLKVGSWWIYLVVIGGFVLALAAAYWIYHQVQPLPDRAPVQRILTQFTFDEGLQMQPTWSPDGSMLAYASNRHGSFDIFVQSEQGKPIQITENPSHDWQPAWSPTGKHIAFRSERDGGGLFVIPASGGVSRKVSSFGYEPVWDPAGEKVLFYSVLRRGLAVPPKLFLVGLDGNEPTEFASDFTSNTRFSLSAAWHPDGEGVSLMGTYRDHWGFWTYPVQGEELIQSEVTPEVERQMEETELILGDFSWSPQGEALFFEGNSRSVQDVWKVSVETTSLRWTNGPERLTASPDIEGTLNVTADGTRLAFDARDERPRISMFPFDPRVGRITGEEWTISSGGMVPDTLDLSRDGNKLAFATFRAAEEDKQLWVRSLETQEERILASGDYRFPCWSRDGSRLACRRAVNVGTESLPLLSFQVVLIPVEGGEEQVMNSAVLGAANNPADWSKDGKWILMACRRGKHSSGEDDFGEGRPPAHICLQPIAAAPHAEEQARILVFHEDYDLWQHRFSPDDSWILFNAVERRGARTSKLFVTPTSGGEWIAITDGNYWADKPVWAPDGTIIYYVSNRGGFFNVWGRRFDPAVGRALGEPFQVTHLDSPSLRIDPNLTRMEIAVSDDQLALQLMEVTGNIWVLEETP